MVEAGDVGGVSCQVVGVARREGYRCGRVQLCKRLSVGEIGRYL